MEVSFDRKTDFLRNFHFFFWLGPIPGGRLPLGKLLSDFHPGVPKMTKNWKTKSSKSRNSSILKSIQKWTYGGEFWPKNPSYFWCQLFTFFFWLGPILGGHLLLGLTLDRRCSSTRPKHAELAPHASVVCRSLQRVLCASENICVGHMLFLFFKVVRQLRCCRWSFVHHQRFAICFFFKLFSNCGVAGDH